MRRVLRRLASALIAFVVAAPLAACADGDASQGIVLQEYARIEVDPPGRDVRILAGNVPIGETDAYLLTIRNTGEADLLISEITLTYAPPAGVSEELPSFTLRLPEGDDPARAPIRLQPSGSVGGGRETLPLRIVFRHQDREPRSARLVIRSDSREHDPLNIVFTTEEGQPVLVPSPREVDFGSISSGQTEELPLTLLNNGNADLLFAGFQLIGHTGFTLVDPANPAEAWPLGKATEDGITFLRPHVVAPNRSLVVPLRFTPQSARTHEARLVLFTNDSRDQAGLPVRLVANRELAHVGVRPESVDFGIVPIGATRPRVLVVASTGSAELVVHDVHFGEGTSTDFELDLTGVPGFEDGSLPSVERPLRLGVGRAAEVRINFTPDMEVRGEGDVRLPDTGSLVVATNAFDPLVEVPLTGTGAITTCPVADARVLNGEEVTPQTVLQLRGDGSLSSCGAIERWEWSVTQPDGSASSFIPAPTFDSPTFAANAAGRYRFCLRVWDTCGLESCEPSCVDVIVVPDEALHVELLWRTPGDPDEYDEGPLRGSDLDLHFAHPFALIGGEDLDGDGRPDGWFNQTYDTFWANPKPDWGSFSPGADDDPSLDRDDTDGAGPENVNLNNPEDLTQIPPEFVERLGGERPAYRVGVHYWNDHGFGPAFATLRVYVHGALVYEKSEVELRRLDFWSAVTIDWPAATVTELRAPAGGLRIAPNYEHPAFVAP
jgi:hypothetical protein